MRIFGDITHEDAENEGQMLSELCRPGRSRTVVEVRKHGWLPRNPSLYYIDMEYCPETLESRIHGSVTGKDSMLDYGFPTPTSELPTDLEITQSPINVALPNEDTEGSPTEFDWQSVVAIIEDINQGLIYLHENHTVHRDLKPKNGRTPLMIEGN